MATPKPRPAPAPPTVHVDLAFGDAEFNVAEFASGEWRLDFGDTTERLIVTTDQMQEIVGRMMAIGRTKGWT